MIISTMLMRNDIEEKILRFLCLHFFMTKKGLAINIFGTKVIKLFYFCKKTLSKQLKTAQKALRRNIYIFL